MANAFTKAAMQTTTTTENGAKAYASTGSNILDQFGVAANYRGRDVQTVFADQAQIWGENAELALRFIFYLRMITRKTRVKDGYVTEDVQRGQGIRDEVYKRLLWVATNHEDTFYKNLWILPIVGSWKDLWMLMVYDRELATFCLKPEKIFEVMAQGMECEEHVDLIKKFMPRIKSFSKVKTDRAYFLNDLAKAFAKYMEWNCAEYNKFKSSGRAHEFQKVICGGLYDNINWNCIPGKALSLLTNSKFLEKHGLTESYTEWVKAQPTVKFNGYVHELAKDVNRSMSYDGKCGLSLAKRITIDKQFEQLIRTAMDGGNGAFKGNVMCCIDTSGSMGCIVDGKNTSAYEVCTALGVYFSSMNTGAFNKAVMMFDDVSRFKTLSGGFCDMLTQIRGDDTAWGSTNFMSIVHELCRIRRENPNIPLEEFPTTLLVVSDMQFNAYGDNSKTNYEAAKAVLSETFPQEYVENMKFVWWNLRARANDNVPATMDNAGCYLFSGFDGSILSLLLGQEEKVNEKGEVIKPSMEDAMISALSQEILLQVAA